MHALKSAVIRYLIDEMNKVAGSEKVDDFREARWSCDGTVKMELNFFKVKQPNSSQEQQEYEYIEKEFN